MSPREHEKAAVAALLSGNYDEMVDHAKRIPINWDFFQQIPSNAPDGLPDEAFHKIMDHLGPDHPNKASFLNEYAGNLPANASTETLNRAAKETAGNDYLTSKHFLSHPNWKRSPEDERHHHAANFWLSYEKSVHPSHFATIKSLQTGKPESFQDYREKGLGTSSDHMNAIPHLREYAKKAQAAILDDKSIPKREFKGQQYIKVHRGLGGHYAKAIKDAANYDQNTHTIEHKQIVIPKSPFSSWTTNKEQAERFANNRSQMPNQPTGHGVVISKWMPVKDVLHSGFHSVYPKHEHHHPSEEEIIFQHPTGKTKVSTKEMTIQQGDAPYSPITKPSIRKPEKLEKGIKDRVIQFATAASMLGIPSQLSADNHQFGPTACTHKDTQTHPDLAPIAVIESANGKNTKHKVVNYGLNAGTAAVGVYGLMPVQVNDTLQYDKALGNKYSHLLKMDPIEDHNLIKQYLTKNLNAQKEIANSHWRRLGQVFQNDIAKMAHAWKNGITGTVESTDEEIKNHPYVQKYLKLKKMLKLENKSKPKPLNKSQDVFEKTRNIKKFVPSNPKNQKFGMEITNQIQNGNVHNLENEGHFTHSSFVVGPNHDNAWLLKVESESKSAIQSAQHGLQVVKEAAFYDAARSVFGLDKYVPEAVLGEVEKQSQNAPDHYEFTPAVAIKFLPPEYKLASDMEQERPGSFQGVLEPYRRSGLLHKFGAMMLILGEADAHGGNELTNGTDLKLIDHGTSFADKTFNPGEDKKIFIPYFLRIGKVSSKMTPEDKFQNMKKIDNESVDEEVKHWLFTLDEDELRDVVNSYGIDPEPSVARLQQLKQDVSNGRADQTINKWWTLGFQLA